MDDCLSPFFVVDIWRVSRYCIWRILIYKQRYLSIVNSVNSQLCGFMLQLNKVNKGGNNCGR